MGRREVDVGRREVDVGRRPVVSHLCHVGVDLAVVGGAREVLPLDEALNAFLDDHGRGQEARAQLFRHLRYQQRVLRTTQYTTLDYIKARRIQQVCRSSFNV